MNNKTLKIFIIILLSTSALFSLSFPSKEGKIIIDKNDLIIRLLDSPNSSIKTAEALFIVDSEPEKCFNVINNILDYPNFMPNISETKFISKSAKGYIYDFIFEVAFFDIEYTLLLKDSVKNDIYSLDWTFVKGEINDSQGSWSIRQTSNDSTKTEIYYKVFLDPDSFLPDWVTNRLTARSIPEMVESIRKRVKDKK